MLIVNMQIPFILFLAVWNVVNYFLAKSALFLMLCNHIFINDLPALMLKPKLSEHKRYFLKDKQGIFLY